MQPHSVLLRAESKRCHYRWGGIRRQILVVQIPTRSRYWHSRQTWLCGTITRFSLTFRRYSASSPKQIMIARLTYWRYFWNILRNGFHETHRLTPIRRRRHSAMLVYEIPYSNKHGARHHHEPTADTIRDRQRPDDGHRAGRARRQRHPGAEDAARDHVRVAARRHHLDRI